jgi:hypothetical protein
MNRFTEGLQKSRKLLPPDYLDPTAIATRREKEANVFAQNFRLKGGHR